MPLWKKLFGMAVASLRDIGFGLLAANFLAAHFGEPVTTMVWYGLGVLFAILPDTDIIVQKIAGAPVDSLHRQSVMHTPIIMIGGALALYLLSPSFSVLAAVCLFLHFVDDTIGDENAGTGVAWLYPFNTRILVIFCKEDGQRNLVRWEGSWHLTPVPLEVWLERFWLRPTKEATINIAVFAIAIAVVLLQGGGLW